jgi:hypothetical protein
LKQEIKLKEKNLKKKKKEELTWPQPHLAKAQLLGPLEPSPAYPFVVFNLWAEAAR